MTLTKKQKEVITDITCTNNPWLGVQRGNAARTKLIGKLVEGNYITLAYNGQFAWATDKGMRAV